MFSVSAEQTRQFAAQLVALANDLTNGPVNAQQLHQTLFDRADRRVLLHVENGRFTEGRLLDSAG
jgi:hypothetical protein